MSKLRIRGLRNVAQDHKTKDSVLSPNADLLVSPTSYFPFKAHGKSMDECL